MSQTTAIITGASTGIGYELAHLLAQKGYQLGLIARREDLLINLKKEIEAKNPGIKIVISCCDVADTQKVRKTIFEQAQELGRLDLFVANAGVGGGTPGTFPCWEMAEQILSINIMGAIASIEAAKEVMLKQGSGHIVGIASVAAVRGLPEASAYSTSKAALQTYLESLRIDLKQKQITVTSIHPGFIDTPLLKTPTKKPFIMSAEKGAWHIWKAISKKKSRYVYPWQMRILYFILKHIPNGLYDFFMSNRGGMFDKK